MPAVEAVSAVSAFLLLLDLEVLLAPVSAASVDFLDLEEFFEVEASAPVEASVVSAFFDLDDFLDAEFSDEAEESALSDFLLFEDFLALEVSVDEVSSVVVLFFFFFDLVVLVSL